MYSKKISSLQLQKVQKTLNFDLQYYPIDVIQQFKEEINNLINLDLYNETVSYSKVKIEFKSPSAKKTFESREVQQIIQNEAIICQWDAFYWMERYYQISDITNRFILYSPTIPQKVWSNIFARLEEAKRAIRLLCLKARQTTMTTFAQGIVQHRIQFLPDVKSLIASKQKEDTFKMSQMLVNSVERQPFWIRSQINTFDKDEYYTFKNGSFLDLGWGTQKSLGRGNTPTVCHLSEIASFKYPYQAIENALIRAMHETVWLLQIFEGTAEGRDDWLHNKWNETVEGHEKGISSLYPSFIPYFARFDIYPAPAWFEARKEFYTSWTPKIETIVHAKKCENYVKTNRDLREFLRSNWKMPRVQMFWYELSKEEAIRENRLNAFLQEVPADPEEAFQHAGRSIYPIEILTHYSDSAQLKIPEVYKLRGDSNEINPLLWPNADEIKLNGKVIPIRSKWTESIPHSDFELVEINFNGWDNFDAQNKILIWEHPDKYRRSNYGAGFDPSDGLGRGISDNAVLEIIKKGTVESNDKQVCEFASSELPQAIIWPYLLSLCTYFSPYEQLLLTIETNLGFEAQNAMINHGWSNLFKSYDEGRVGQDLSKVRNFGIKTNTQNREALVGHLNAMLLGKWIELYSMPLIGEIKDLQKIKTASRMLGVMREKILGKKDDRFMATGICVYGLHRDEILGFQKKSWETRKRQDEQLELKELIDYSLQRDSDVIYNPFELEELGSLFEEESYY